MIRPKDEPINKLAVHLGEKWFVLLACVKVDWKMEFDNATRYCIILPCAHYGCTTIILYVQIYKGHLLTMTNQMGYQIPWLSYRNYSSYLSRHGFCMKSYCDLNIWPTDLKCLAVICWPVTMTNLPIKYMYHDCHSKTFQDIERTWFLQ